MIKEFIYAVTLFISATIIALLLRNHPFAMLTCSFCAGWLIGEVGPSILKRIGIK